jgi:hypothetical protein
LTLNWEQVQAEANLLRRFLNGSDEIGLTLPGDCVSLRRTLEEWKKGRSRSEEPWPPDEVLPLMALAQHSGLPSRLLDLEPQPAQSGT